METATPTIPRHLRIVLVEDSSDDAELIEFALRRGRLAFSIDRVETAADFNARLDASLPDVVLCDYHLPQFSMEEALSIVRKQRSLDLPFIVVSRLIGEEAAAQALRDGAHGYVLKGRLAELPAAVISALERAAAARKTAPGA